MSYPDQGEEPSWADAVASGVQMFSTLISDDQQPDESRPQFHENPQPGESRPEYHDSHQPVPTSSSVLVNDALSQAGDSLEQALCCLWKLDVNRLVPSKDYSLDPQSKTHSSSHDAARTPLIVEVCDTVWEKPTFSCFKKLLDNYTADTGVPERVSSDEREEEETFLGAICDTPCIQFAQGWLAEHSSECPSDMEDFKDVLRDMWFRLYCRDGSRDSSGFEHVFCGEIDDGKVKGLHNFIQVHVEEQRGNFDYKGYLNIYGDPSPETPPPGQQMLIIRFEWLGYMKSISSMFIGTSPEFEIALYSMLWLSRRSEAEVQLGPYSVRVKAYDMAGKIGSAFPELLDIDTSLLESEAETTEYNQEAEPAPAEDYNENYESSFPALG